MTIHVGWTEILVFGLIVIGSVVSILIAGTERR